MVAAAAVVVLTSLLLLEDASVATASSAVEFWFGEGGETSSLPVVNWLVFFWVFWMRVMVVSGVGVGRDVFRVEVSCGRN